MNVGRCLLFAALIPACAKAPRSGPPNLVLVSLDTTRADRLGAYGNTDGLTPNLDRFAAEATVFDAVYSQATLTSPSHASMFSSRYPTEEMSQSRQPQFGHDKPVVAEVLKAYGYQTGAFVSGGDLNPHMGLTGGFDVYQSPMDFGSLYHTVPLALRWLDGLKDDQPFFAFIHGYDAHARYLKPTPFGYAYSDPAAKGPGQDAVRSATERLAHGFFLADVGAIEFVNDTFLRTQTAEAAAAFLESAGHNPHAPVPTTDADVKLVRDVYDGAISYGDTMFGLFMAGMQERGRLDDTVIVVMGDHGEQLGEKGLFNHCCGVDDTETHVPLMVRLPHGASGGRHVSGVVELTDVAPTLIAFAGATPPAGARGVSLKPALEGAAFPGRPFAFTQGGDRMRMVSARSAKGRLTYTGLPAYSPLLPDVLEAARVPGPGFEVTGDLDVATQKEMQAALVAWLRSLSASPKAGREDLPDGLKAALRTHGYWQVDE